MFWKYQAVDNDDPTTQNNNIHCSNKTGGNHFEWYPKC